MCALYTVPDCCLLPPPHHRPACSERKNVNLPGVNVDLPTLTDKDIDDLVNWVRGWSIRIGLG